MKCKVLLSILSIVGIVTMCGCSDSSKIESKNENIKLFPTRNESFVGDPMPFFDGNKFNIFYLDDLRDTSIGFHPWSLFTTDNFYEYEDMGEVIPYSHNTQDQDLALGTGSVIRDSNGLYHAFYTGYNENLKPKEAIMHATSTDMITWNKIPEDKFFASEQYSGDDFRDPYVIYNEDYNEYWMLITTRKDNAGVIALYTSSDLKVWNDQGVFFENDMETDSNLECPTLIKYGDYWYLSFSDQWPDRVVHYRIAKDSKGPFSIPEQDNFDGNGFYAGRMEKDDKNLYIFGWTPTKVMYMDEGEYDWGGNLVVHQLVQKENGELEPIPVKSVIDKIDNDIKITPLSHTETIEKTKNNYTFSGNDYEIVTFPEINGVNKITGKIKVNSKNDKFGFMFNVNEDTGLGSINMVFDVNKNELQFYNTSTEYILAEKPQSTKYISIDEGDTLEFTILIDDSIAVLYVNDVSVLSTRMMSMQDQKWGIFSVDSNVVFEEVKLSK